MRLAVVAQDNPYSEASWSGIPFHALQEIRRRFDDVHVVNTPKLDRLIRRSAQLARGRWDIAREPAMIAGIQARLTPAFDEIAPDVVISIAAPHKVAWLVDRYPVIHVTDAMFDTMVNYYQKYATMSSRSLRLGHAVQHRLVDGSRGLMVASQWAAQSAAAYYNHPIDHFTVAPLSANFKENPPPRIPRANDGPLKLLFVGFNWQRKGGPLALQAFQHLRVAEPQAEFHIVGCRPPGADAIPGVQVHGVLRKGDPAQALKLAQLLDSSHFFLMPSRQEAYGLVYCEACAFSLPPVATDTGGVGEIIRHGENGLLLPPDADAAMYSQAILNVWRDSDRYVAMQLAARRAFNERLNWRAWGDSLEHLVREIVGGGHGPARQCDAAG